jgi:AraC-like DNA-binding protein
MRRPIGPPPTRVRWPSGGVRPQPSLRSAGPCSGGGGAPGIVADVAGLAAERGLNPVCELRVAYSDPVVERALRILREQWTIAGPAGATNVSRATLARRFNELVGEPHGLPDRLADRLAADVLLEPGATVGSVAHEVGYGSPFALSAAFKRVSGISPRQHRAAAGRF